MGFATGLLTWGRSTDSPLRLLLGALLMPALVEEFVFRGVLTPAQGEAGRPVPAVALGLVAYVQWHVLGGLILPGAGLFLRPDFLLCAFLLGLACAWMRYRTGSLWPAILFHALLVWAWQAFLGGVAPADFL